MIAFSPADFPLPLPPGHRFPLQKYAILRQRLVDAAWEVRPAIPADLADLLPVHSAEYIEAVRQGTLDKKAIRALGFPWSPEMILRSSASVGGTLQAARQAMDSGYGVNLAGGTHHAFADRGEGFCVFNDAVIAAEHLHRTGDIASATIVDLDVHQGNGTAKLAQSRRWLKTISVHGAKNYPFHKESSDLDVELPDGTDDHTYLQHIERYVLPALELSPPDVVFLNAGVDVLAGDRYGRLQLSQDGVAERDDRIYEFCQRKNIPLVWIMGGGYQHEMQTIANAHFASLQKLWDRFAI